MKVALFLLFVLVACVAAIPDDIARYKWTSFLGKYNKNYANAEEYQLRFNIFRQNLERIDQMNAIEGSAVFGVTKYSDLTAEEFRNKILIKNADRWFPTDHSQAPQAEIPVFNAVPTSWNWVDHGAVTPIYNQAQCGSCWAFSTAETIESQWFMAGNTLTELSQQQIVSCDTYDDGCGGGNPPTAYYYVHQAGGLEYLKDYPYTGTNSPCKFNKADIAATINGWHYITKNKNETEMLDWSYSHGPISVCVDAATWQNYNGGIIQHNCGTSLDHCVQIVGWDTSSTGVAYWIVRNSWGTDWGLQGFLYVARNNNVCGIAQEVTAPIILSS